MRNFPIKPLLLAITLGFTSVSWAADTNTTTPPPVPTGDTTTQPKPPVTTGDNVIVTVVVEDEFRARPLSRPDLLHTNRQVYYQGDDILVRIASPKDKQTKAALKQKKASLQLLVRTPAGDIAAYPIEKDGSFLDSKIDTSQFAPGIYELALILTRSDKAGKEGDATKLGQWYGGFSGLLTVKRVKISDKPVKGADPEDDANGNIKGDTTSATDGFRQPDADDTTTTPPTTDTPVTGDTKPPKDK